MTREELLSLHDSLCKEAKALMVKKNQDYGANSDPFRNFRAFGSLGILVRMSDKLARLQSYLENGKFAVEDEGVKDTVRDIINYAILFEGLLEDGK